jgi:hypothetical protein
MNVMRHLTRLAMPVVVVTAVITVACTSEPKNETSGTTAAPAAAPATPPASTTPRIFFTEPKDGDKVKSPVKMKFDAENYTISAVPAGEVTTVRPNTGHFHVAVDADCMAPGQAIPKGVNWVHLGKGDKELDTQLAPGPHKLTLAIGDDKHVTIEGLCQTINVVAE